MIIKRFAKLFKAYLAAYFAKVADPCEMQPQEPSEAVAEPLKPKAEDNFKELLQAQHKPRIGVVK